MESVHWNRGSANSTDRTGAGALDALRTRASQSAGDLVDSRPVWFPTIRSRVSQKRDAVRVPDRRDCGHRRGSSLANTLEMPDSDIHGTGSDAIVGR